MLKRRLLYVHKYIRFILSVGKYPFCMDLMEYRTYRHKYKTNQEQNEKPRIILKENIFSILFIV